MATGSYKRRTWFGFALVATAAIVAFSAGFRRPPPSFVELSPTRTLETSTATPVIPQPLFQPDASVRVPRFATRKIRNQVELLRSHAARTATPAWHYVAPQRRGSFWRERWCESRLGPAVCAAPALAPVRPGDPSSVELDLVRDLATPPTVLGFRFATRNSVAGRPWTLELHYSQGGGRIAGHGLALTFVRDAGDGSVEELSLGTVHEALMGTETCRIHAPGLPTDNLDAADLAAREELARLLDSPTSFRDTVENRLDRLIGSAEAALVPADAASDLSPNCPTTGLSPEEARAWLDRIRHDVAQRRDVLERNYVAFHTQLRSVVPPQLVEDQD